MPSDLFVEVCKINNIIPHGNNADRLEIAIVKGWQCTVPKNKYQKGDKVIYIPIDAMIPYELSEQLGITKYLTNPKKDDDGKIISSRVRTSKQRGVISQGVVIDLPDPTWKVGKDVKKELGITKYEPVRCKGYGSAYYYKKGRKIPKWQTRAVPGFDKYTHIQNFKNFPDVIEDGEEVVISEKVHGCVHKSSKIKMLDNTEVSIKYIVDKKLQCDIVGVDNNGNLVKSKILNWYNNGKSNDWYKLKISTNGSNFKNITVTKNHEFFNPDLNRYIPCSELKPNDSVLLNIERKKSTFMQKQKIISIDKYKGKFDRYDIETETHNYFANGVLVHNSNFRSAKLEVPLNFFPIKDKTVIIFKKLLNKISFGKYPYDNFRFLVGSHNCNLKNVHGEQIHDIMNVYWKMAIREQLEKKLRENEEIFGEIYGYGIQKLLYDSPNDTKVKYFDIKVKTENGFMRYLDWDDFVKRCQEENLSIVPVIYQGTFKKDILVELSKGKSTFGNHIREGVVVKPVRERMDNRLGRVILKYINDEYLLHKNKLDDKLAKKGKEAESDLFDH